MTQTEIIDKLNSIYPGLDLVEVVILTALMMQRTKDTL